MLRLWRAFAKINLDLRVLGKRSDGYHEVRTLMQTIDLHDDIRVSRADSFRFTTTSGPAGESNLVVRAVRCFEAETATPVRLALELVKRIPAGAGLGGGSADAAATLLGLSREFGVVVPGERLLHLLGTLGSDVPFFATGGSVLAVGRGERLFPMRDPDTPGWYVLVMPDLQIQTVDAYSWLTETSESNTILGFCARFVPRLGVTVPGPGARLNDFEAPVFHRFPELAEVKERLWAAGARSAALTGSGATLFGEFAGEAEAGRAAEALGRDYAVAVAGTVPRSDYFRRLAGG
jgi:4-diphosphocytidyl-2-C-methyl-D-erythritol kinase